jgi:hypothetical protein
MDTTAATMPIATTAISSDKALQISRLDAESAYQDLSGFRIQITLECDGGHIEYDLKNPNLNGGGPHYVIDPVNGTILSKEYYQ